jgi:hypothetical protein
MSVASEGIWFPIADSSLPIIPSVISRQIIQPIINAHDVIRVSRQPSIRPGYWSPIGPPAKATTLYGLHPTGH